MTNTLIRSGSNDRHLGEWLVSEARHSVEGRTYSVLDVTELCAPSNEIAERMSAVVRNARYSHEFLEDAAEVLGWSRVREMIQDRLPTVISMKRGTFGEVLTSQILKEFHEYLIPIEKLRYVITRNQSLTGTDLIAFKLADNGSLRETCFIEVKLRTRLDAETAREAYAQLKADYEQEFPATLQFIAERLREQNHAMYQPVMDWLCDRRTEGVEESFRLFLVWDDDVWDDRVLEKLDDDGVDLVPLTMHVVRIGSLAKIVESVFSRAGIGYIDQDE